MRRRRQSLSDQYWTSAQVAQLLEVSTKTVEYWRYARKGPPAFRIGRYVRYREADVREWIEARRKEGMAA